MIRRSSPRRALAAGFAVLLAVLGLGGTAWAYFGSSGSGAGAASVGTISAPTDVTATQPDGGVPTLRVGWTDSADPKNATLDGYYVQRYVDGGSTPAAACGSTAASLLPQGTTSCTDPGRTVGSSYAYRVVAVYRSWSAPSSISAPVSVAAAVLSGYSVSPSTTTPVAGTAFTVTIAAIDQSGHPLTGYSGTQCLSFTGPARSPDNTAPAYPGAGSCPSGSAVTFAGGAGTATITLYDAQTVSLTATDVASGKSGAVGLTVGPRAANSLSLAAATTTPTAGVADNLTITALDPYGNTATGYTGAHNLTFGGASGIGPFGPTVTNSVGTAVNFGAPTSIGFTNGIAASSAMTLYKAGSANVTVTDGTNSNGTGPAVTVRPAGAASLSLAAATTTPTAGVADNLTITALDPYGNTATGYTGAHNLTFGGASAIGTFRPTVTNSAGTAVNFGAPTSIGFTNGIAASSAMTLYKIGSATITATDGTNTNGTGLAVTVGTTGWQMSWTSTCGPLPAKNATCTSSVSIADQYGNAYSGPTVSLTVALQDMTHFSVSAGTTTNPAVVSASGSPSGTFTVQHIDNASKSTTLTVTGPSGFTPPAPMTISS